MRPRPAFEARPQVDGVTVSGSTGMEVDASGRVAARTCPRCQTRLDDVDDRGTHPWCEPTAAGSGLPDDPDRSRT